MMRSGAFVKKQAAPTLLRLASSFCSMLHTEPVIHHEGVSTRFSNTINDAFPVLQPGELMPGVTTGEVSSRRKKLMARLPLGSLALFTSATVKHMTDVVPYPYRQSSDYFYFTGCRDPGGLAVIYNAGELCMFMPDPDPKNANWEGQLTHAPEAVSFLKATRAYNMSDLSKAKAVFAEEDLPPGCELEKLSAFKEAKEEKKVQSIHRHAYECRFVKSPAEINLMRQGAKITSQAFVETMKASRARPSEHVLAATLEFECRRRGAQRLA